MTITKLFAEFAIQLTVVIGERIKEAIGETLIKVPGADASPRDIAIATKSAVSADREGKIASEQAKAVYECGSCFKPAAMVDDAGRCPPCGEQYERLREPLAVASERGKVQREEALRHCVYCGQLDLKLDAYGYCLPCAEDRSRKLRSRRLGDYGPGGE